jgi:hypothetical protein
MTQDKPDQSRPDLRRNQQDKRGRYSELDAATTPASGAAVEHAFVGAELAAERAHDETEEALKRAAGNDRRHAER